MRIYLITFTLLFSSFLFSQNKLTVDDIAQKELHVMEKYKNSDSVSRKKAFANELYTPYKQFWNGYLGNENDVTGWLNSAMTKLPEWQKKDKSLNSRKLLKEFEHVAKNMEKLTGYAPHGKWYIVYGPAWTDLGGLGNFAMLIDLAHGNNTSNDNIVKLFPHELTHQIMSNVNQHKDSTAIEPIIGEGFAVWMNQKYWGKKYSLAENLGYTEDQLKSCDENLNSIKKFFEANKYSADKNIISVFRSRNDKLSSKLPGAIGYYIGYRIVEAYVKKHGENSWKDVFTKSPKEIYETSGFTN